MKTISIKRNIGSVPGLSGMLLAAPSGGNDVHLGFYKKNGDSV